MIRNIILVAFGAILASAAHTMVAWAAEDYNSSRSNLSRTCCGGKTVNFGYALKITVNEGHEALAGEAYSEFLDIALAIAKEDQMKMHLEMEHGPEEQKKEKMKPKDRG